MNDRIPGTTWSNPIWYRDRWRIYISGMDYPGLEYEYMHDDYDGDSDTENRAGHCESIEACKQEIHDQSSGNELDGEANHEPYHRV